MWRTAIVLVSCLAVALAYPEVRAQNVVSDDDTLIAEVKRNALQQGMSLGKHNSFDATPLINLQLDGQKTTLDFGPDTSKTSLSLIVSLDDDTFFVYDKTCNTDGVCTKKKPGHTYDSTGKTAVKNGNVDQDFSYKIPSSGNTVTGLVYTDNVAVKTNALSATTKFAAVNNGEGAKDGLPGDAEGYLGLGFEKTSNYEFGTINALFGLSTNKHITIKRNLDDLTKGVIALGQEKLDGCNFNRTTEYQPVYQNPTTRVSYWWFNANATIGKVTKNVVVKVDLNSDNIGIPSDFIKVISDANGGKTDTSSDISKLPTLSLTLLNGGKVLSINSTTYTGNDKKTLLLSTNDGKSGYDIVLGSAFLRHYCAILQQNGGASSIAFTLPDPPPQTKFATVSGVSFMALALIPLVNLFRF